MTTVDTPVPSYGTWQYQIWYPGLSYRVEFGAGDFSDPQGLPLAYSATLADGTALPSWLAFDTATGTLSGTVPSTYQQQNSATFDLTVTATNNAGLSASAPVDLQIYKVYAPSQSDFAPTVHVLPGQSFTCRMPADILSDPQGLPMTYSAVDGNGTSPLPSWITFDPATLTFSGTAPSNAVANHPVQLHATDSAGQTGSVWFTIYFTAGPPNLSIPTADQSWTVGQAVNFTLPAGTFTDPQGQALTYTVTGANGQQIPSWLQFNPKTLTFSGTPPNSEAGLSLGIEVTATDTGKQSTSENFTIQFVTGAAPKLVTPVPAQSWSLNQTIDWTAPVAFTDSSGIALAYSAKSADGSALPSWLKFDPTTLTFTGTAPGVSGILSLEIDATNVSGARTGDVFTVTIGQPNPNATPPNLTDPTVSQYWAIGQHVSFTLAADTFTDPQGLPLTYSALLSAGEGALPSWLTFDPTTRTFSGIVPASGASLGIEVIATDSAGASATENFVAMATQQTGSGSIGVVKTIPASTWQVGQAISITPSAGIFSDPANLPLTYSGSLTDGDSLPSWLKVDPATGTITGTAPFTGQSISVRLTATDSAGNSGHDDFLLNVPAPYAPELKDSVHDQSWTTGQTITLALPVDSFSDPQGEALTYSAKLANGGALPNWLTFNAATQTFSGTVPSNAASLTVTVTATDSSNLSDSETFAITIGGASQGSAASESAAYVSANFDALEAAVVAGKVSSVALTDGGTPTLALSSTQVSADAQALGAISGSFSVTQTATGSNLTIAGVAKAISNTVVFSGNASSYTITPAGDGAHLSVSSGGSTDQVSGVQALQFGDVTDIVAKTPSGSAVTSGNVTVLYGAVLGREPDVGGLGFYQSYATANPGTPLIQFAEWFLSSAEYTASHNYAQTTAGDTQFIEDSYQSLLHRAPTQSEIDFYLTKVLSQPGSQLQNHAQMLVYFSASSEFVGNVQVTAQNPSSASHWLVLI